MLNYKDAPERLAADLHAISHWLHMVFLVPYREGGIHLRSRDTNREMTMEERESAWNPVMICSQEIMRICLARMDWKMEPSQWMVLAAAAFLISVHTLFAYDYLPAGFAVNTLNTDQPPVLQPNGSFVFPRIEKKDYLFEVMSRQAGKRFSAKTLEKVFWDVFEATDWKGCAAAEEMMGQHAADMEAAEALAEAHAVAEEAAERNRANRANVALAGLRGGHGGHGTRSNLKKSRKIYSKTSGNHSKTHSKTRSNLKKSRKIHSKTHGTYSKTHSKLRGTHSKSHGNHSKTRSNLGGNRSKTRSKLGGTRSKTRSKLRGTRSKTRSKLRGTRSNRKYLF